MKDEHEQFKKERNEAFLSLDENLIRAFYKKYYDLGMPNDMDVFWVAVHRAITEMELPLEVRRKSKDYLASRNLKSFDDGDL